MLKYLWNRYTKLSLFLLMLSIISLFITFFIRYGEWPTYFPVGFSSILVFLCCYFEIYGVIKARDFFKEDAIAVYQNVNKLREDLKELSPMLHRDFDGAEDSQAKYASDKRYRKLMKDFKRQLAKCHDCRLETSLKSIIQREILLAKYRLNANDAKFRGMSNAADEEIRQYIDTKMKSRDTV